MVKRKLQEFRLKKGYSQEEIADLLGMTQPNYSRKENGITRIFRQEWEFMAKKLNIDIEDIFEEHETTMIHKNNRGNSFNSGTININMIDFLLEHIELLKTLNELLKYENQALKDKLNE